MARTIVRFEDIEAWQTARRLVRSIYTIAREDPMRRDFRFRDQICGAALSVMSNIAEGYDSSSRKDFIRYMGIARASASEVRSQLYAAKDLH